MSLNGKRTDFSLADFRSAANRLRIFRGQRLDALLQEVDAAVEKWPAVAAQAGVPTRRIEEIFGNLRRLEQLTAS